MTTATKAKRFLAAAVLGTATGPVWAQGFGGQESATAQQVSVSQLFQGLGGHIAPTPPAPEGIRWRTETLSAYKEAADQGKPLVIFFSNERCVDCRGVCKASETIARLFADPRMAAMADRAVFVRLDFGRLNAEEQRSFQVLEIKKLPTVAMLDARNGKLLEVGQLIGEFSTDTFVAKFSEMMTRYADNRSAAPAEAPQVPTPSQSQVSGTAVSPTPAATLTPESLPSFLAGLGYEVKPDTTSSGVPHCLVTARRGEWKFVFDVSFSKDGEMLWLIAGLGRPLPGDEDLAASTLVKLMMMNDKIGPSHFSVSPTDRRVFLNLAVPNQGISPARFRTQIEQFLNQIVHTQELWRASGTSLAAPAMPVAPTPPVPQAMPAAPVPPAPPF